MYSTAFCAFPVAHLEGSIYNTSCDGSQWLETAADRDKAREDVARLTYLHLGKYDIFFRHFTVNKTSLPLPAERLSRLYIQCVAHKYAICK